MKRAIFIIPADTALESLTPEQQAAIASVDSQFALPMPGTQIVTGKKVVDGLVSDAFDPAVMAPLGLDWQLLMLVEWDGIAPAVTVLYALDLDAYMPFVPPINIYDVNGNVTDTTPAPRQLTHDWAGWTETETETAA